MELATNAVTIIIEEEDDVPGFGKLMLSRYAIGNIFALRDPKNVCRVTYDYFKQYAFVVHMGKKKLGFSVTRKGCIYTNPITAIWNL